MNGDKAAGNTTEKEVEKWVMAQICTDVDHYATCRTRAQGKDAMGSAHTNTHTHTRLSTSLQDTVERTSFLTHFFLNCAMRIQHNRPLS